MKATPAGMRQVPLGSSRTGKDPFLPAVYYAMIDGAFYLTLNEAMLRDFIDRAPISTIRCCLTLPVMGTTD